MTKGRQKLEQILLSDNVVESINNNLEELTIILPEIRFMIGFEHKNKNHHLDVWNHTLLALSLSKKDYIVRLTLLLHDIGKPFSYQEGIERHFKNHEIASARISYNILKRLNYDDQFIEKILYLIKTHDYTIKKEEIENDYETSVLKYQVQYCDVYAHHPDMLERRIQYLNRIEKELNKKNNHFDNLILIAAIGQNNELGKDNKLIWPLKEDLKFFRNQTMNKRIVMGYNTYLSLPKLLPGRKHLILTHRNLDLGSDVKIYHSKDEVLDTISKLDEEVYIIGGSSIYEQFINNSNTLLLTEIEATSKDADAYFPEFNKSNWTSSTIDKHTENDIKNKYIKYVRKKEWKNE